MYNFNCLSNKQGKIDFFFQPSKEVIVPQAQSLSSSFYVP